MRRVAVLGSGPLLAACAPASVPGLLDVVELQPGATAAELRAAAADAVVALEPGSGESDLLAELAIPALVWRATPGLAPAGPAQRLVLANGDQAEAWRWVGLPVADRLYANALAELPARAAWLGPPSPRRASYLSWFKHDAPPAEDDVAALVAVNIHVGEPPEFEPEVARALAAGRLLVSETLRPARGLEAGIDYLAAGDLDDLFLAVESAVRNPQAFRRVRLRGHRKAELFRASRVVCRLVDDLLLELGSGRSAAS